MLKTIEYDHQEVSRDVDEQGKPYGVRSFEE